MLAPPSGTGSAYQKVSSTKQLMLDNGAAAQKTQRNGFLASQKMTPETARKATEKMSQKTARQSDQRLNQNINNLAVNNGSSTLMTVASLSNSAIDQLLKTAQSLDISADNSRNIAIESLLFDAGVAVPEGLGHQVFNTKDRQVHPAAFETDEPDAPQDSQALEDREAEMDESVISAFDIGDFEEDAHATEEVEANELTAAGTDSSSSDFDPDDLELDPRNLEALGFGAAKDTEERSEENLYDADDRLETASVSLDKLVSATEQNFLARWLKRLAGTSATKTEASELPEPRLFESDYSQRETQSKSAANHDAENFDIREDEASEAVDAAVEAIAEPSNNLFVTVDDVAERSPDEPLNPLPTEQLFEPNIFDLGNFESDAANEDGLDEDGFGEDGFDEDGFDEDSLLKPLGEKAWLSEADNANESLYAAAKAGDRSGVWAALAANASVNALSLTQRTALSTAVESGHVPVVEMLLEMCADPNLPDVANGAPVRYPLMVAATEAAEPVRDELLRLLLASGAKVNQANVMGQTALMGAAEHGHVDAMRRLIEANADLDAQDLLGQTAMLQAKGRGHNGAIALLQEASMARERAIAFLKAVTQGNLTAVEQWLAAGISANTRVARMSGLTQAAARGEVAIAKLLIEAGADINYRFYETDPTPLFHAAYRGQLEMVALLLEAGASLRLSSGYPIGALDYAEIGQQKAGDAAAFEPIVALLATLATRPD